MGLSQPSWHQWLNYETENFDSAALADAILQSMAFVVDRREEYGFYSRSQAAAEHARLKADAIALYEANRVLKRE
jgi:hypothetical protein